jgi:outer membrane lipoprotein-sorting protein
MFEQLILLVTLAALLAASGPALGGDEKASNDEEARRLFQRMEDHLASIKTLRCDLTMKFEGSGEPGAPNLSRELVGSLALAEGNRVRLELKKKTADASDLPGVPFWLIISDGTRELHQDSGTPKPLIHDKVPESLGADALTLLARSGLYLSTLPLPPVEAADNKDRFPVSEFKLGPKEKIGNRDAQRLDYRFDVKGQKQPSGEDAPLRASVWIDSKTTLPLKREFTWRFMGVPVMAVTESYEHSVTDEKLDAKEFEVPEK